MGGPAPIIDLSSDEEDAPDVTPVPVAAAQTSSRNSRKGVGMSSVEGGKVSFTENVSAPGGASEGKVQNVRAGKNAGESGEDSLRWGEPLPPEGEIHTPVDISPHERVSVCDTSSTHTQNCSDADKKIRAFSVVNVKSSSSPPPPTSHSESSEVCRLFWRAGDYEAQPSRIRTAQGAMDHVRVHPKFLHSNATSHKWALGALAELLDNAVDEVANGATFVSVDKIINPRDSSPALLVQDDGGGMTPDCMRQCMSLGYSRKNTNTTIGQYGNGFKTSTMRLGADVVVFSRCKSGSVMTQSIGLLSYTFLRKTGHEDVVVPMVDYEITDTTGILLPSGDGIRKMVRTTLHDWHSNITSILEWSPYSTEAELLAQFNDLGWHGTKVVVYNLWFNDDGVLELDFDSDERDIQLRGGPKPDKAKPVQAQLAQQHIANRYHHSLRVYASILYLEMPDGFQIILRGQPVEHHNIANDLKFPEQIVYKPQIGTIKDSSHKEVSVVTIIGFTKEAPLINVHGFNVYHKNRLIMPFWKVWQDNSSRGRGVVGVLEANFIEPAHDKQDFERTAVLLRLESRLKQMTVEYWNLHCHLIGYQPNTKAGKARKQATPSPSIDYPAPIASLIPSLSHGSGPLPNNTADLSSPVGSAPTASVPISTRSSVQDSERNPEGPKGSQVKPEPVEYLGDSSKRPSSILISETMHRQKRPRMERPDNSHVPEEPHTVLTDATSGKGNESYIVRLVDENSQLSARIDEIEHHAKKLQQQNEELQQHKQDLQQHTDELELKVTNMDKELMEERARTTRLQQEIDLLKIQKEALSKHHVEQRKHDGMTMPREAVEAAELGNGNRAMEIVASGTSATTILPQVVVKVEQQ